jgi:hypothetical protein
VMRQIKALLLRFTLTDQDSRQHSSVSLHMEGHSLLTMLVRNYGFAFNIIKVLHNWLKRSFTAGYRHVVVASANTVNQRQHTHTHTASFITLHHAVRGGTMQHSSQTLFQKEQSTTVADCRLLLQFYDEWRHEIYYHGQHDNRWPPSPSLLLHPPELEACDSA